MYYYLTCGVYYTSNDSFSESISFNRGTFPTEQHIIGVLAIYISSDHSESVLIEVDEWFRDSEQFKDTLRNYAIKRNFNFTFAKNNRQRVIVQCGAKDYIWRVHTLKKDNHARPL